tara:strand:+ start:6100 stop:6420 length:321 start_codon:yes stop_codon:yes gene_type:complete
MSEEYKKEVKQIVENKVEDREYTLFYEKSIKNATEKKMNKLLDDKELKGKMSLIFVLHAYYYEELEKIKKEKEKEKNSNSFLNSGLSLLRNFQIKDPLLSKFSNTK